MLLRSICVEPRHTLAFYSKNDYNKNINMKGGKYMKKILLTSAVVVCVVAMTVFINTVDANSTTSNVSVTNGERPEPPQFNGQNGSNGERPEPPQFNGQNKLNTDTAE